MGNPTQRSTFKADDYVPLVVAYRNGTAVRLADVADGEDSVEDIRTTGLANGKPAVLVIIFRQPGANIIETVDRVRELLPQLEASIPGSHQRLGRHGSNADHPRFACTTPNGRSPSR